MPAAKLDLLQGTLDVMVRRTLHALGPLHGYGIARRIEQTSGDQVLMNQGTICASLVRLQQCGWIAAEWGLSGNNRRATFYSITRQGRKQLAADAAHWRRLADVMGRVLSLAPGGTAYRTTKRYAGVMRISRRDFLGTAALATVAARAETGTMPTRVLGRTGAHVSILAMGGGSRFLMYKDEDQALEALNRAFDLGISYMDTAYSYGNGLSEERIGKVMKTRRKQVFLATKIDARKGDEAQRIVEGGLKRMQTDHLDLIHVHSLTDEKDLAAVEARGGILETLLKLRDQKVTRFVGITSHTDPVVLKTALERHDFDCTQMALNAARAGMRSGKGGMVPNEALKTSFEDVALPVARGKNLGVIAMKIFAQEALVGEAPVEKLIYYPLSLAGVTVAVAGMPKLEFIDQNVALAKAFKPLPPAEMKQLSASLAMRNKVALDRFFSTHVDA